MKRKFSLYLWISAVLSLLSSVVVLVSFSTVSLLEAEAVSEDGSKYVSNIYYGLFKGALVRRLEVTSGTAFNLKLTCILQNNICAWSCLDTDMARGHEISTLYDQGFVDFTCKGVAERSILGTMDRSGTGNHTLAEIRNNFMNATLWIGTVVFLGLSGVMGFIALLIILYNLYFNPIQQFLTIRELFIWHSVAGVLALLAFTVCGLEYYIHLPHNAAVVDTIMGTLTSDGRAYLGYSYWIILVDVLLNIACIGLIYYREMLFDTRPQFLYPVESPSSDTAISHLY